MSYYETERDNKIIAVLENIAKQLERINESICEVAKVPNADIVEVKHGEWIIENSERDWKDKDTYRLFIKCSECGKTHFLGTTKYQNEYGKEKLKRLGTYADYSFCGKCGAKMDR